MDTQPVETQKKGSMKKVAVVILNWNGEELMKKFLPSVVAHTPQEWAEVIVADNGSTDGSINLLRESFPTVKIIRFEQNHGFASGYNLAIDQLEHPYTVLLNSDIEVTPGWLDAPVSLLEQEPVVAAVQPKILSYRNKSLFEYAGACGGYIDKYGYPFCRGRIFGVIEEDKGQYNSTADILWGSGACLFVRTGLYKEISGLDDYFFAHQEEIDLCWRLRNKGYRIVCTPQSTVYHVGGATLAAEHPHKTFLNFRNNLLMLHKNLPAHVKTKVFRTRFWLDYLAALQFLLKGKAKNAKAIYRARKEFHKAIKTNPAYHQQTQSTIPNNIPEIYPASLLWSFYVKGKKRFSELNF